MQQVRCILCGRKVGISSKAFNYTVFTWDYPPIFDQEYFLDDNLKILVTLQIWEDLGIPKIICSLYKNITKLYSRKDWFDSMFSKRAELFFQFDFLSWNAKLIKIRNTYIWSKFNYLWEIVIDLRIYQLMEFLKLLECSMRFPVCAHTHISRRKRCSHDVAFDFGVDSCPPLRLRLISLPGSAFHRRRLLRLRFRQKYTRVVSQRGHVIWAKLKKISTLSNVHRLRARARQRKGSAAEICMWKSGVFPRFFFRRCYAGAYSRVTWNFEANVKLGTSRAVNPQSLFLSPVWPNVCLRGCALARRGRVSTVSREPRWGAS